MIWQCKWWPKRILSDLPKFSSAIFGGLQKFSSQKWSIKTNVSFAIFLCCERFRTQMKMRLINWELSKRFKSNCKTPSMQMGELCKTTDIYHIWIYAQKRKPFFFGSRNQIKMWTKKMWAHVDIRYFFFFCFTFVTSKQHSAYACTCKYDTICTIRCGHWKTIEPKNHNVKLHEKKKTTDMNYFKRISQSSIWLAFVEWADGQMQHFEWFVSWLIQVWCHFSFTCIQLFDEDELEAFFSTFRWKIYEHLS